MRGSILAKGGYAGASWRRADIRERFGEGRAEGALAWGCPGERHPGERCPGERRPDAACFDEGRLRGGVFCMCYSGKGCMRGDALAKGVRVKAS